MQQLEENASHIVALFSPLSYLLTTEHYDHDLAVMLQESVTDAEQRVDRQHEQRALLRTLSERRKQARERKPSITCLTSLEELRRLVTLGLVGRLGLPDDVVAQRRQAARREVQHLANMMKAEPVGVQIGLVEDIVPNVAFQLFYKGNEVLLGTSPFRIAELPNLHVGVASITSNPEAVELHAQLFDRLWSICKRGSEGARLLEDMLAQQA